MSFKLPAGATPIEDTTGLIPKHITTKTQIDELEFANINRATQKYFLGKLTDKKVPFDVWWLLKVHYEMYGNVWEWAGKARTTDLNIGVSVHQISEALKQLTDDFKYWEGTASMNVFEKAARLHHGLVKIHPFKNGNGRWARFVTNIYLRKKSHPLVEWPERTLQADSPFRKSYIAALQNADRGIFEELIEIHRQLTQK